MIGYGKKHFQEKAGLILLVSNFLPMLRKITFMFIKLKKAIQIREVNIYKNLTNVIY